MSKNLFFLILILFSSIYSKEKNSNEIDIKQVLIFPGNSNLQKYFGDDDEEDYDEDYVTRDKNCNMTEYPEQAEKCFPEHMDCLDPIYLHHCSCKEGYVTYKNVDNKYCNLEQKKQSTAFVLELCVGFGAGHFYRSNYLMGGLKLAAFVFGLVFIFIFPITAKCISDADCDCLAYFISVIYYLFICGLAVWYLWDLIYFGNNYYKDYSFYDQYGIYVDLKPW